MPTKSAPIKNRSICLITFCLAVVYIRHCPNRSCVLKGVGSNYYLVPGARLELAPPFGQRILSSKFAQNETIAHNRKPIRSTSYVARICLLLSNIEYAVGQNWDKIGTRIVFGNQLGPIQRGTGGAKSISLNIVMRVLVMPLHNKKGMARFVFLLIVQIHFRILDQLKRIPLEMVVRGVRILLNIDNSKALRRFSIHNTPSPSNSNPICNYL